MKTLREKFTGCLLGLALGDALGAPYEGGIIERTLWRLIGTTRTGEKRWTDDTQMSLDLARSLIANRALDPDDVAARFAKSYLWSRGYGPGAAKLLRRIRRGIPWSEANRSVYRDGSFGNGGAMRAPVIALFYASDTDELVEAARTSARITHAHPLGIEGAVLIATAVSRSLQSSDAVDIFDFAAENCKEPPFRERLEIAREWIVTGKSPGPREIVEHIGHGIVATESCVTSLYLGLRFIPKPFSSLHKFVAKCGGDTDTIGSMSGAIWGAANGAAALPEELLQRLEQREKLEGIANALYRASIPIG